MSALRNPGLVFLSIGRFVECVMDKSYITMLNVLYYR